MNEAYDIVLRAGYITDEVERSFKPINVRDLRPGNVVRFIWFSTGKFELGLVIAVDLTCIDIICVTLLTTVGVTTIARSKALTARVINV